MAVAVWRGSCFDLATSAALGGQTIQTQPSARGFVKVGGERPFAAMWSNVGFETSHQLYSSAPG